MWYLFLGMMYFCIGTCAVCGNFIVLKIFGSFPALRTPANMLVMNLAFSDFALMLSLFPEMVYNFFCGGSWQFGETACQIHAFLGSVFGYSQIFTLTVVSWDRYNVIVKGFSGAPLTFSKVSAILFVNYVWSIFWAVLPLVGFGAYGLDGILGTCSYDYVTQTETNKYSILALCITNYLIPLAIIIWAYSGIVGAVFKHEDELRQQAKKMNVASLRSNTDQQSTSAEIRIAKVAIINVSLWTIAWTPFAVICMLGTWGDVSKITPLVSSIPVIIAKTSCCYNPVIYAISHPKSSHSKINERFITDPSAVNTKRSEERKRSSDRDRDSPHFKSRHDSEGYKSGGSQASVSMHIVKSPAPTIHVQSPLSTGLGQLSPLSDSLLDE